MAQPGVLSTGGRNASRGSKLLSQVDLTGVSEPGLDWLRVAFAAPDFDNLNPQGVPDNYTGRTLPKIFRYEKSYTVPTDDSFLLLAPVPGISHYEFARNFDGPDANTTQIPSAQSIWLSVPYSDTQSLFGSDGRAAADQVTSARFMGNSIELVPTTNAFKWSGSVSAYRVPLKMSTMSGAQYVNPTVGTIPVPNKNVIVGGQSIVATANQQYTAPSNMGVFACAFNNQPDNRFTDITENTKVMNTVNPTDPIDPTINGVNPLVNYGAWGLFEADPTLDLHPFTCMCDHDTIVVRVQGAKGNTFVLKTWAAVEFQPNASSSLYSFSRMSPRPDPAACAAYRRAVQHAPVAVSYYENANIFTKLFTMATNFFRNNRTGFNQLARTMPGGPLANLLMSAITKPGSSQNQNLNLNAVLQRVQSAMGNVPQNTRNLALPNSGRRTARSSRRARRAPLSRRSRLALRRM